jgi:DNA mismatch endonuclease (patch repair protein)
VPDIVDKPTRSRMMSGIRGRDTQPELRVRRRLHAAGLRFRLHAKDLPGKPDIVLAGPRTVVFVDGCFWHQHPGCAFATLPRTNVDFWRRKLESNVARDTRVRQQLAGAGWRVETVWECEPDARIDELLKVIELRRRSQLGAISHST